MHQNEIPAFFFVVCGIFRVDFYSNDINFRRFQHIFQTKFLSEHGCHERKWSTYIWNKNVGIQCWRQQEQNWVRIGVYSIDQISFDNLPSDIKMSPLHFMYKNCTTMIITFAFKTKDWNFRSKDRPPTWRIRTKTKEKGESELVERNSECECHLNFDQHVCGDDGITYPSSCTAKCHHVVSVWPWDNLWTSK